jgi:hypothetical protein
MRINMTTPRLTGWLLIALLVPIACGCGGGKVPVYPVSGQVLIDGKPAEGVMVRLEPQEPPEAGQGHVPKPMAYTEADGKFQLTTYAPKDGAPAGRYRVAIEWKGVQKSPMEPEKPDRLKRRYIDPANSKIEVQIEKKPNELEPIRLDLP